MNMQELEKKILKNPEFAKEYYKTDVAFEISEMIIDARIEKGLTQKQLADRIGTKQSSIARWESGSQKPSISSLEKIAVALNIELIPPKFALLTDSNEATPVVPCVVTLEYTRKLTQDVMDYHKLLPKSRYAENFVYNSV